MELPSYCGGYFDNKIIWNGIRPCCYTKLLCDSNELCLICMLDESENNINLKWDRYQLCCGHQFHTRCLRKWCNTKQKLNCSLCGDIELNSKNEYCNTCHKWGHSTVDMSGW